MDYRSQLDERHSRDGIGARSVGAGESIRGVPTTPEAEIREAIDSGKPERIKAAFELAAAPESGDNKRVKAAIDALAKTIRKGT